MADEKRITVALRSRATAALDDAIKYTGDNTTDVVNRALQLYAHLLMETERREKHARPGTVVFYLTDAQDSDSTEQVVFA